MRMILWLLTILFALAGLALREDGGFGALDLGIPAFYAPYVWKGCFILAFLGCPFIWGRPNGLLPGVVRGKTRFMLALALLLATPLILPWPF